MYVSYRHILALACVAVAFVACAVAFRIYEYRQTFDLSYQGIKDVILSGNPSTTTPDSSFYSTATSKPKSKKAVLAADMGPPVSALAYLVGNVETGAVYESKNEDDVLPVASMSKLITAIAATDTITPATRITITADEMEVASDTSMIGAGETFTARELMYPMLLNSSNVAAEALASSTNRIKFLELMSSYAWEVGMKSTFFADPSGLSAKNISTAHDFFALAQYLYKDRPDILALTRIASTSVATTTDHGAHQFVSIHPFVNEAGFIGGKTGHTDEAQDTMLTIININGQPIAIIVLHSRTGGRAGDTEILIDDYKKQHP